MFLDIGDVVPRSVAIKEVMRDHKLDRETATALVDAAIQASTRQTEINAPFLKQGVEEWPN